MMRSRERKGELSALSPPRYQLWTQITLTVFEVKSAPETVDLPVTIQALIVRVRVDFACELCKTVLIYNSGCI